MVLVIGATGLLGGEICRRLVAAGTPVRALTRPTSDPTRVAALRALGVKLVHGDLKDPASLDAACKSIDTVISTASITFSRQPGDTLASVDQQGQIALIGAARAADVVRFVYVSVSGQNDVDCPLMTAKRAVEQKLMRSGMDYTILRPSYFMEVWLSPALGFDAANGTARVYGSGEKPISFISYKDVAQFAVASVDNPAARNAIIELGGPEALTPMEVVGVFEKKKGRRFQTEHVPEDVLEGQRAAASDPLQQSFASLMLAYAHGDAIDMKPALARMPLELTSVREFADVN